MSFRTVRAWILEHGSLVNARRWSGHPVVRERQQLVDSLARLLSLLGLERRQAVHGEDCADP